MLRRRWASPARSSQYIPASSGPRCVMTSRISGSRARSSARSRSAATMPAMPHMLDGLRVARARGGRPVDELAEPELEHHQLPQAVAVIGAPVAVFCPEARHFVVVEHAAIAQTSVGEERLGHRRERAAEPFADRRLEAVF